MQTPEQFAGERVITACILSCLHVDGVLREDPLANARKARQERNGSQVVHKAMNNQSGKRKSAVLLVGALVITGLLDQGLSLRVGLLEVLLVAAAMAFFGYHIGLEEARSHARWEEIQRQWAEREAQEREGDSSSLKKKTGMILGAPA